MDNEILIKNILSRFANCHPDDIRDTMSWDDLGLDTIDREEVYMELQDEFGVTIENGLSFSSIDDFGNVEDLIDEINSLTNW